jgi:hypothetical protein
MRARFGTGPSSRARADSTKSTTMAWSPLMKTWLVSTPAARGDLDGHMTLARVISLDRGMALAILRACSNADSRVVHGRPCASSSDLSFPPP